MEPIVAGSLARPKQSRGRRPGPSHIVGLYSRRGGSKRNYWFGGAGWIGWMCYAVRCSPKRSIQESGPARDPGAARFSLEQVDPGPSSLARVILPVPHP